MECGRVEFGTVEWCNVELCKAVRAERCMARRDVSSPSVGEITPGVLLVIHRNLSSHFHLSECETGLAKAVGDLIFWLLLARA